MIPTFMQFMEGKEGKKPKKSYDYSSVLYMFPEEMREKVCKWSRKNVPDEILYQDPEDPTFGREDETHCTVLYGIHDKTSINARKIIKEFQPFHIKLGKMSAFTPEKFDVLKIDVTSPELHELHEKLCEGLEVTKSFPEYKPHVTIAYLKKGESKDYVGSSHFQGTVLEVKGVVFSSRAGVKTPIPIR